MAETATRTRTFLPSISMRIFCRFGLKRRLVMPVTLRPTPPRYLALPRRRILLPPTGFFPVIKHCMPITMAPESDQYRGIDGFDKRDPTVRFAGPRGFERGAYRHPARSLAGRRNGAIGCS